MGNGEKADERRSLSRVEQPSPCHTVGTVGNDGGTLGEGEGGHNRLTSSPHRHSSSLRSSFDISFGTASGAPRDGVSRDGVSRDGVGKSAISLPRNGMGKIAAMVPPSPSMFSPSPCKMTAGVGAGLGLGLGVGAGTGLGASSYRGGNSNGSGPSGPQALARE